MFFYEVFTGLLRNFIVPFILILLLRASILGDQGSYLAVVITLTLMNVVSIGVSGIRLFIHMLTLRGPRALSVIVRIIMQILGPIVFWTFYYIHYVIKS